VQVLSVAAVLAAAMTPAARGAEFTKPTKEELEMTSLPGYPGVSAVVLYREEITRDDLHVVQHYERIKILTEEGKKYANVELGFVRFLEAGALGGDNKDLNGIEGRTIHADGTIVPFTGKPYLKVLAKAKETKVQEKVFTLPDVQVGSIIEYRYETRYNDNSIESPDWYIQGDLYVKQAHYQWWPTTHELIDYKERPINMISWFPILPQGAKIVHTETPASSLNNPQQEYDLMVKDVPPMVEEEYMPPIKSYSYRVLFNFTPFRSPQEYWKDNGKEWSKHADAFAKENSDLRKATDDVVAGATTDDAKLRKIYAAVMQLENSDFTREHEKREDKANGLGKMNDAYDVLTHKRGDSTQMTELFVAMARAAGLKADMMLVSDRSDRLFTPLWLNFEQLPDMVAVVSVDGKDKFFDPGSRYCGYGSLAWQHTWVQGLRQKDGGTEFAETTGDSYADNKTSRVANLKMDPAGQVTGHIDLTFTGAPALRWRQAALRGDEDGVKHDLKTDLEKMVPKTLNVQEPVITGLEDYEKPLTVSYQVTGSLGTPMGKRLMLPADIFLIDEKATFPQDKREQAVYYHYPQEVLDAQRVNFLSGFQVEAVPPAAKFNLPKQAIYALSVEPEATNFTTRRSFVFNEIIVPTASYPQLRGFYAQFEAADQQSVVLKRGEPTTASASGGH
jgi:hypothetical protein